MGSGITAGNNTVNRTTSSEGGRIRHTMEPRTVRVQAVIPTESKYKYVRPVGMPHHILAGSDARKSLALAFTRS